MKKRIIIIGGVILALGALTWVIFGRGAKTESSLTVFPRQGKFEVTVTTTGELQAKNSIEIQGPGNLRKAQLWQVKISDLVPEGTVVKQGDYVGKLDESELLGKIKEVELNLQKLESQFLQAKLDCTLTLAQARDELVNLQYASEQRKLEKEESIYESPSTKRQAEIEYEKAQRAHDQAKEAYDTKVLQAQAKMNEVGADLSKEQQKYDSFLELIRDFTIKAPENGMVIYARDWDGTKKVVGSAISSWQPTVATLPDLSVMESVTYVNEVDIKKIQIGQKVSLGLEALPDKKLNGEVTYVANIGEQRPNSDSKVFEVKVLIEEGDSTLRPSMTTTNIILIDAVEQALSVPLESIRTEEEQSYVYRKKGGKVVKKPITLGLINENEAIVESGLTAEDEVYLSTPENPDEISFEE